MRSGPSIWKTSQPAWMLRLLISPINEMHLVLITFFFFFYFMGGGDARRVHLKKNSEKPAKGSKSENYCWTELVFTSTAPPFGKGQLRFIRVQFC